MTIYAEVLSLNYAGQKWAIQDNDYSTLQWLEETPAPTQSELDSLWSATQETQGKNACKKQASQLLYETDWTTIPDVANTANTPYLMNQADFIAYRNQVRQLAVNPVANPTFPTKPTEQWSS